MCEVRGQPNFGLGLGFKGFSLRVGCEHCEGYISDGVTSDNWSASAATLGYEVCGTSDSQHDEAVA